MDGRKDSIHPLEEERSDCAFDLNSFSARLCSVLYEGNESFVKGEGIKAGLFAGCIL